MQESEEVLTIRRARNGYIVTFGYTGQQYVATNLSALIELLGELLPLPAMSKLTVKEEPKHE